VYAIQGESVNVPDWSVTGYRLPTEAEWEYACRAGSRARYGFDDDPARLEECAWWSGPSGGKSHAGGQKLSNALGLCDMQGNVGEYCWDGFDPLYYRQSPVDDPIGPPEVPHRVVRGGNWASKPRDCRPSVRRQILPGERSGFQGLRVVRLR